MAHLRTAAQHFPFALQSYLWSSSSSSTGGLMTFLQLSQKSTKSHPNWSTPAPATTTGVGLEANSSVEKLPLLHACMHVQPSLFKRAARNEKTPKSCYIYYILQKRKKYD